jgi:hypothetical protein
MEFKSEEEISATKAEYERILSLIDGLNKHAHYKAEFIIRWISEHSEKL